MSCLIDLVQPPRGDFGQGSFLFPAPAASKRSINMICLSIFFRRKKSFFSQFSRGFSSLVSNNRLASPRPPSPAAPE